MAKLAKLENKAKIKMAATDGKFTVPTFTQHLDDLKVTESENANFTCKINPHNDPNMKVCKHLIHICCFCATCDKNLFSS